MTQINIESITGGKEFESQPVKMTGNCRIISATFQFLNCKYEHYSFFFKKKMQLLQFLSIYIQGVQFSHLMKFQSTYLE